MPVCGQAEEAGLSGVSGSSGSLDVFRIRRYAAGHPLQCIFQEKFIRITQFIPWIIVEFGYDILRGEAVGVVRLSFFVEHGGGYRIHDEAVWTVDTRHRHIFTQGCAQRLTVM